MAERFVKPKRFTKKWWSYFWEYYKWYVVIAVFLIISVIVTVVQVKNQPVYIFNITYAGEGYIPEEPFGELLNEIGDGMTNEKGEEGDGVLFTQLNFDYSQDADIQYTTAMQNKLQVEFIADETMLFLFDKAEAEQILDSESFEDVWLPVSEWAEVLPSEELIFKDSCVCLKNSEILNKYGITGDDVYVAVRRCYNEEDEAAMSRFKNSIETANKLIK